MSSTVAVPLLLFGCLTLLGTAEAISVAPLMRRYAVPACCRRRVTSFEARAGWTLLIGGATALAGLVLLLL